jgi:hypothetical protein
MKRRGTPSNAQPVDATRKYNPVYDWRNERVRGLWERNAVFYAQVNVRGWIGRMPLHEAKTLPEAPAARQVLKAQIKAGKWKTPPERERDGPPVIEIADENRVLKLAIAKYQESRNLLGKKDSKTCKREDSGLKLWAAFKPDLPIVAERFDQKPLMDFAS